MSKIIMFTFFYYIVIIFVFAGLYMTFKDKFIGFNSDNNFMNYLLYSSSITTTVGNTTEHPNTNMAKFLVFINQMLIFLPFLSFMQSLMGKNNNVYYDSNDDYGESSLNINQDFNVI